jgi:hypothetical protein
VGATYKVEAKPSNLALGFGAEAKPFANPVLTVTADSDSFHPIIPQVKTPLITSQNKSHSPGAARPNMNAVPSPVYLLSRHLITQ